MDNSPYAPPQAPVADVTPEALMARPWQVRAALGLWVLSLLVTLPAFIRDLRGSHGDVDQTLYRISLLTAGVPLCALIVLMFVLLARGYRWARIIYSALTLLGFFGMFRTVPVSFELAWYFGVLNVLSGLLGAATLWLLFTGPANAWFRTRGGRFEAP